MDRRKVESRLERWSRVKRSQAREQARGVTAAPLAASQVPRAPCAPRDAAPLPTEADLAGLGAQSDYTRFMQQGVSLQLRARALRALWASEAALCVPDGLIDYGADYTVTAASQGEVVTTVFRAGRGLLTDDEADAWLRLGRQET